MIFGDVVTALVALLCSGAYGRYASSGLAHANYTASNGTTYGGTASSTSKDPQNSPSGHTSTALGDYIIHGLGQVLESRSIVASSSTLPSRSQTVEIIITTNSTVVSISSSAIVLRPTAATSSSSGLANTTRVLSNTTQVSNTTQASNTTQGSIYTLAPYTILGNTELQYVSCLTSLMSYFSASNAWYSGQISKGSYTITTLTSWFTQPIITTVYPTNASTYKLCDGSPRANIKPMTITSQSSSYVVESGSQALPATFLSQPCTLGAAGCAWLSTNTTMSNGTLDDYYLVEICGLEPDAGTACVIQGGPIRLLYWPVSTVSGNLCDGNGKTVTVTPTGVGPDTVVTLGTTLTSPTVYLSFSTLYARAGGYLTDFGPTFSDVIIPFPSQDISTVCGGFAFASTATQLNFADLNYPVPASAYNCMGNCEKKVWYPTGAAVTTTINPAEPFSGWTWSTEVNRSGHCATIWDNFFPNLAAPTALRTMMPEWSTCSFYDAEVPDLWWDPPIALQQQSAIAMPTIPASYSASRTASSMSGPLPSQPASAAMQPTPTEGQPTSTEGQAAHSISTEVQSESAAAILQSNGHSTQDSTTSTNKGQSTQSTTIDLGGLASAVNSIVKQQSQGSGAESTAEATSLHVEPNVSSFAASQAFHASTSAAATIPTSETTVDEALTTSNTLASAGLPTGSPPATYPPPATYGQSADQPKWSPAADSSVTGFVVGMQTLSPGGPAMSSQGTVYSALPSGFGLQLVISSRTSLVAFPDPNGVSPSPEDTGGTQNTYVVVGNTITAGGELVTAVGTTYSALPSGLGVIVAGNGMTSTIQQGFGKASIDAQGSSYAVNGQTVTPGGPAIIAGSFTYSALPSGLGVIVAGNRMTSTIQQGFGQASLAMQGSSYVVNGQTVTPGGPAITANGSTYSALRSRSGLQVVADGITRIIQPASANTELATLAGGMIISAIALPATAVIFPTVGNETLHYQILNKSTAVIGSQTLSVGGAAVTGNGETISLAMQGTSLALIFNSTSTVALSPAGQITAAAIASGTASSITGLGGAITGGQNGPQSSSAMMAPAAYIGDSNGLAARPLPGFWTALLVTIAISIVT